MIDKNFYATDKEAFNTCRFSAKEYGILVGGSSGGVIFKALEDINRKSGQGSAVILVWDGGKKYLNNVFNDEWMEKNNLLDSEVEKKIREWI